MKNAFSLNRWALLGAILASGFLMGGCGGDSASALNQVDVDPSSLQGTWGGTYEPFSSSGGQFQTIEVTIDSNGDITDIALDSSSTGITGNLDGTDSESSQVFQYTLDDSGTKSDLLMYVDSTAQHAGLLTEDGSIGVVEKGATPPGSFTQSDAVGSWSGFGLFFVNSPLAGDALDPVTGTLDSGTPITSNDFQFGPDGGSGTCADLEVELSGFNSSYGVYDTGTVTGGTGTDCPGSSTIPFDAYMSFDGNFMVVTAGFEGGADGSGAPDEESFVILSRQ